MGRPAWECGPGRAGYMPGCFGGIWAVGVRLVCVGGILAPHEGGQESGGRGGEASLSGDQS
eukprot:scaffold277154_cov31-Tisochrysis_lutea.AAC.5